MSKTSVKGYGGYLHRVQGEVSNTSVKVYGGYLTQGEVSKTSIKGKG